MFPYKVSDHIVLCENAVYLPKAKTLVIGDLQLGMEQQLRDTGSTIFYEQAVQMLGLIETLLVQTGATNLVINGDLKHDFGKVLFQERNDITMLLSTLRKKIMITVVRGNHDTMTASVLQGLDVSLVDAWSSEGVLVLHGHKLPDETAGEFKNAELIVIGHVHPAITLSDGVRKERYKCFLLGKYKKKQLLVLPSFSTIVEGSDILQVASNSPLLQGDSSRVYVLADEIRPFGTIKQLRRVLELAVR